MALLLKRYRAARRIGSVHPTGLLKIAGICGKPTETPPAIVRTVLLELAGRVGKVKRASPRLLPEFGHKLLTAKIIPDANPASMPGNDLTGGGELPMFRPTPVAGTAS